jgi:hypothetical protein
VFDENSGSDSTWVFAGSLGELATLTPGLEPQPFSFHISFNRGSFYYVPAMGNLSMEITLGGIGNLLLDSQLATGDGVGRVFADTFNTSIGQVDSLGLITQFDIVPIPEPSCELLMLLVAVGCAGIRGLKRCWIANKLIERPKS